MWSKIVIQITIFFNYYGFIFFVDFMVEHTQIIKYPQIKIFVKIWTYQNMHFLKLAQNWKKNQDLSGFQIPRFIYEATWGIFPYQCKSLQNWISINYIPTKLPSQDNPQNYQWNWMKQQYTCIKRRLSFLWQESFR